MPVPDVHFDIPFINDAFDPSRYPTFKTMETKMSTMSYWRTHYAGRRALFACPGRGFPFSKVGARRRARNVSEPQLISSTNHMRESWFTNLASACTVGDIAHLFSHDLFSRDDVCAGAQPSQSNIVIRDSPRIHPSCGVDDGRLQTSSNFLGDEESCELSGHTERTDYKAEEDSLYSMDSADHESHPLLLSMPIIPQIKLERQATIRKPDSEHLQGFAQNQSFLSPRIRAIRTPARISSRRYGRILPRDGSREAAPDDDVHISKTCGQSPLAPGRFGSTYRGDGVEDRSIELACANSRTESMMDSHASDENEPLLEGADEPLHSEVLFSVTDEMGSSLELYNDSLEAGIDKLLKRSEPNHRRSSLNHSISFSSILHTVADGCASLDVFLRKPKSKVEPKSKTKLGLHGPLSNAHSPAFKWAPKEGQVIIKVFVPSTDDIWMFRVPQDINLADFTSRVVTKLGFAVSFSGSLWDEPKYYFSTDERFWAWVKGRVRFGRNLPLVAHVHLPLPLVRLSVDGDGCEVWCCA